MTTSTNTPPAHRPSSGETATSARLRSVSGLASSVSTAYTAAHGHPLDHEGLVAGESARRRWSLSLRVALVAGVCVVLLAGGVVAFQIAATPGDLVSLDAADPEHVSGAAEAVADADDDATETEEVAQGGGIGGTPAGSEGATTGVLVHVVGQVVAPGVVDVPDGSRVTDAITAAGGLTPDADTAAVNLAREVVDGEQIYVPLPGESAPVVPGVRAGTGSAQAGTTATGLVDVNRASVEELDTLPGIGPALAARIVQWRTDNGTFSTVDQLADVSGIGPSVLGKIRDLVTV